MRSVMSPFILVMLLICAGMSVTAQTRLANIHLRSGNILTGYVQDAPSPDKVLIRSSDGSVLSFARKDILRIEEIPIASRASIGIGFGIPYGTLGLNADIRLIHGLYGTLGVGTNVLAGASYAAGVRYYLLDGESAFRPRVSVLFGTNSVSEIDHSEYQSYAGLNLCLGMQLMFGERRTQGLDVDLVYIASSAADDVVSDFRNRGYEIDYKPNGVKFSIGYRYAF